MNVDRMRKYNGGTPRAHGSVIEIFERSDSNDPMGVVIPNRVRVNGYEMLLTDDPIEIGELSSHHAATVRMTIFARRLTVSRQPAT